MSVGYIPQIAQILRTKSSEGLDLKSFGMIFVGILLYEIYAIAFVVLESSNLPVSTSSTTPQTLVVPISIPNIFIFST